MNVEDKIRKVRELESHYKQHCRNGLSNSHEGIDAFHEWYHAVLVLFKDYFTSANEDYNYIKNVDVSGNGYALHDVYREISSRYVIMLDDIENGMEILRQHKNNETKQAMKKPKIFISHKTEDKPFVNELVRMLEFIIGTDEDKLFCSSIAGYDIKPGREILAELKRQFDDYEIFFIIVHSPRYYESPICLNEMGAAWVLGTKFCSFLTDDCKFSMLKGAIDSKYISIKVNDDFDTVISKLNSLKDDLIQIFSIENFNNNRWETIRNEFIQHTQHIDYAAIKAEEEKKKLPEPNANIVADVISTKPLIIDITNRGEGKADELELQLDEAGSGLIITGLDAFPLEYLKPGKHVKLSVYPCISDPEKFKVYFKWKENGVEFNSEDIVVI